MQALTAREGLPKVNPAEVATVTDTVVRFGSWLDSLAGRPLDPSQFFGSDVPSVVGRARLTKLTGHLARMITRLTPHAEKPEEERIEGVVSRLEELKAAHAIAVRNRDAQRDAQKSRTELSPELARTREEWLRVYTANKFVIEGILRHHDQLALKSLVFDDLAEVQRTKLADDLEGLVTGPDPIAPDPNAPSPNAPDDTDGAEGEDDEDPRPTS